jgi:predicted CopG family antitoxin
LMSDWTYGGGASLKYRFGFVNIHLTNQRVYAEFMLLHKCIVDIPFSQIENFKKEKRGFSDVLVIDYLKNNKKQCVILNVGKDTDSWLKKLSESIKKSRG